MTTCKPPKCWLQYLAVVSSQALSSPFKPLHEYQALPDISELLIAAAALVSSPAWGQPAIGAWVCCCAAAHMAMHKWRCCQVQIGGAALDFLQDYFEWAKPLDESEPVKRCSLLQLVAGMLQPAVQQDLQLQVVARGQQSFQTPQMPCSA
jgi:hypothetical protein